MAVVGERLDDVGPGALEVHVQGAQGLRMFQRHLGDELPGGEVAAALELELEPFRADDGAGVEALGEDVLGQDRKSTRLNSSHVSISYAVFCLKKKIDTCC